jgi:mediator of RNA polymerase II transcription subunit 7
LYPDTPSAQPTDDSNTKALKTVPTWTLDRAFELKKIVRSMLLNYLELIGIISQDPTCTEIKLQHLTTLFLNAHHIINEYRPHQARETLILMAEERITKMKAEIEAVKQMKQKLDSLLGMLPFNNQDFDANVDDVTTDNFEDNDLNEATWAELEEELGT